MNETRKCDPALGRKVNEHLISLGLETPMKRENFDSEFAIKKIQGHFENIMKYFELYFKHVEICKTPSILNVFLAPVCTLKCVSKFEITQNIHMAGPLSSLSPSGGPPPQ